MYNSLNDAKSAVNNGIESATEIAEHAFDSAKKGVGTAKTAAEHSALSVISNVLKGVSAAAGIVTMLRRLDLNDGLSWFGLARRRNPLSNFAIFGAGIVVGAGVGLLCAPMSGAETRRAIREPIDDFLRKGTDTIRRGEAEIEHKVEELASKAEHKAEELVGKAEHKVEELAGKAEAQVKKVVGAGTQERPNERSNERPNERPNGRPMISSPRT